MSSISDRSQDAYECISMVLDHKRSRLNDWEERFSDSIVVQFCSRGQLSEKQIETAHQIFDKYMNSLNAND